MKNYNTLLFDLDGTLLDTLYDLYAATNHALAAHGYPERSMDEVRMFVGNGVKKLIDRAVPDGTDAETAAAVLADFRTYYAAHSRDHTAPYPGILLSLKALHDKGWKMAVISNKFDAAVKTLNRDFFSAFISVAIGDMEGRRKKPAPDSLYAAMEELGVRADTCIYIGDSDVDIETAKNASIPCIGCAWGFRGRTFLREHGLPDDMILDDPAMLYAFVQSFRSRAEDTVCP